MAVFCLLFCCFWKPENPFQFNYGFVHRRCVFKRIIQNRPAIKFYLVQYLSQDLDINQQSQALNLNYCQMNAITNKRNGWSLQTCHALTSMIVRSSSKSFRLESNWIMILLSLSCINIKKKQHRFRPSWAESNESMDTMPFYHTTFFTKWYKET